MTEPGGPASGGRQKLSPKDWRLILISLALAAICIAVVARYFSSAFPEASIDFRYDRSSSRPIAEKLLAAQRVDVKDHKHAVRFDSDDQARIFLERTLGLDQARPVLRDQVRVWSWHHRWFRPLVEEEVSVDVAPTGEIIGYTHVLPEDRAVAGMAAPLPFLRSIGVKPEDLTLVSTSERRLPKRVQRIYTYDSKSVRPAGALYRHTVTIDGSIVTSYTQSLKVPDAWLRSYRELRSKNAAAGSVDMIFTVITMIAAVVVFIIYLRRAELPLRFLLGIGIAGIVLVGGVTANSMPSQLAYYDTTTSYPAFIGQLLFFGAIQSIGTALLLIVICGAGEVLYRRRLPQHLAMPRIWTKRSIGSKRVFLSLILGYALVPMFIAYQVVFYLAARRVGAWAPAEVPYDDMLNTALPWVGVLFAGFFPAFSEEFLSRAFSIPFFQRIVRSRVFAIVLAGFIWGFGHSTYPNQPFWIRGVEVGIAGVVAGFLMDRFGLLPLLIWHYTIDAVYTATLLFASGNPYYVASAAAASLIFAVPLVASIVFYVRNRGFIPDDDLTNAAMPFEPPEEVPRHDVETRVPELPPAMTVTPARAWLCVGLIAAAALAIYIRPVSPDDAVEYRITKDRAKEIAQRHIRVRHERVIATPVEGFRSWDSESPREEGGAPGEFDSIGATWLVHQGMSIPELVEVFRTRIEAGTWMVRFFTPLRKEEIFVEVDPRTERVVGYHKYQDEANPGPSLPQRQALLVARGAFIQYDLDPRWFELKETLTYMQPRRRDWLFHFDEKTPIAANAFRRVTVRVAGAEVTQFNKTLKVPESVYREANTQTLLNVILMIVKIAGTIALLALVITGLVVASRRHGLPWRRALRWTLILSIIPIAATASRYESMLFGYSTSTAWETFRISLATAFIRDAGLRIGMIFLALAGLEAVVPYVRGLLTAEGRARFGKSAVVAALTALAILVVADVAGSFLAHAAPWAATVGLSVPIEVAIPLPSLIEGGQAITSAILFAAAIALYAHALREKAAWVTMVAVFCASVDPLATIPQVPLMLLRALVIAGLAWVVGRYVLGANPLAWPLFAFVAATLQMAAVLAENHRPDLTAHAIALAVFAVTAVLWAWRTNARGSLSS